jgi:3-hydroxypropanoate dehydrogenase
MALGLDDAALDQLFRSGRSVHTFTSDPVTDTTLRALYDLMKWGPTAFNSRACNRDRRVRHEVLRAVAAAVSGRECRAFLGEWWQIFTYC